MRHKSYRNSAQKPRRRAPIWVRCPSESTCHKRVAAIIETPEQAEKIRGRRLARLSKLAPSVCAQLEACPEIHGGCRKPNCPNCARSFRLWRSAESESLIARWRGVLEPMNVTIIFREVPAGQLTAVDLKAEIAKLRVDLSRSIGHMLYFVGGVEAAWRKGAWSLHVHVVALGPVLEMGPKLKAQFKARAKRAVVIQPLKHLEQVTYAGKFNDTLKLAKSGGGHKYVPLPDARMLELHQWWARYSVRDFLFLYGVRVLDGKLQCSVSTTRRAGKSRPGRLNRTHRPTRLRK